MIIFIINIIKLLEENYITKSIGVNLKARMMMMSKL